MTVTVLMYHGVGQPAPHGEAHYTFAEETFADHLDRLARAGGVVPYEALLRGSAPAGAFVLTFDDGERSVVERALPLMRARGMVGTLFVTTGWIGAEGYVDAEQIRALDREGWTLGTHGVTHRFLSDLDPRAIREELEGSRSALARVLGRPPLDASLPGGRVDRRVVEAARRAGYRSLSTSLVGTNPVPPPDPLRIRRTMMIRSFGPETLQRVVAADRLFYLKLQARQAALGLAKRAVGNRRYELARGAAFRLLRRFRAPRSY